MNERKAPPTPALDRLKALAEEYDTQAVGEFLEWASTQGLTLCRFYPLIQEYLPSEDFEALLYEYVGASKDEVEREKQSLIDYLRALHQETETP